MKPYLPRQIEVSTLPTRAHAITPRMCVSTHPNSATMRSYAVVVAKPRGRSMETSSEVVVLGAYMAKGMVTPTTTTSTRACHGDRDKQSVPRYLCMYDCTRQQRSGSSIRARSHTYHQLVRIFRAAAGAKRPMPGLTVRLVAHLHRS